MLGEPHWRKSDPPLKNHTRAVVTEAMYTLEVYPDAPNDEEATHQGQIFQCIQKEWTAQVQSIRETAEADKDDGSEVDKGDSKQANRSLNK